LWPLVISRHKLHSLVEFKVACSQSIMPNLENLKSSKVIRNMQKAITIK
jgi:hypothetical protein